MFAKHLKDIIFLVIILLLIAIIWGVSKEVWILISINVIVVLVGILYIKFNAVVEMSEEIPNKEIKKLKVEDSYESLKSLAEEECNEFLKEADYEKFEGIIKGKEISQRLIDGEIDLEEALSQIKSVCKFKSQIYYLGLSLISTVNVENLTERDYNLLSLAAEVIKSANLGNSTDVLRFLSNTELKINV